MPLSKYQIEKIKKRNREMLQMYKTGMTTRKLGQVFGLTQGGAHYALKQAEKEEEQNISTV